MELTLVHLPEIVDRGYIQNQDLQVESSDYQEVIGFDAIESSFSVAYFYKVS